MQIPLSVYANFAHPRLRMRMLHSANERIEKVAEYAHSLNAFAEAKAKCDITDDHFSANAPQFAHAIQTISSEIGDRPLRYLEIGCFEGLSLVFAALLTDGNCELTAADLFLGSEDGFGTYGKRFTNNMRLFGLTEKLQILRGASQSTLPSLSSSGAKFDVIFIDGAHSALEVMIDACNSWKMLEPGGLLIFDDYLWELAEKYWEYVEDYWDIPKNAVDRFIDLVGDDCEIFDAYYQVILRKSPNSRVLQQNTAELSFVEEVRLARLE